MIEIVKGSTLAALRNQAARARELSNHIARADEQRWAAMAASLRAQEAQSEAQAARAKAEAELKAAGDPDLIDSIRVLDNLIGPDGVFSQAAALSDGNTAALGWDQASVQERAGITAQTAARAINGTGVSLELAAQLADLTGSALAVMIGPYECGTCHGEPPAGYGCLECGTEGHRQ